MAKQIETVQRGQAITAEAWNALVERINRLERDRFSMTVPPRIPKQKLFPAAPFVLYTDWQKRDDDKIKDLVWWAGAHPIDFKTGEIDYEQDNIVKVYAPLNTDDKKPAGSAPDWKFWAIWKDERWVTLQTEIGEGGEGEKYVAGLGIDVGEHNPALGGRPITNVGVRSVRILGSSYEAHGGPLNLSSYHFQWRTTGLSGETECYLKTYRVKVVTDVKNGTPEYKTIEVIGAK